MTDASMEPVSISSRAEGGAAAGALRDLLRREQVRLVYDQMLPSQLVAVLNAVVFVADSGMAVRCASAPPSTFPRFAASSVVPALLPPTVADFFGLVWPQAPSGVYTLFMALTAPDSLAAGAPLAGNVLALSLANVTLGQ